MLTNSTKVHAHNTTTDMSIIRKCKDFSCFVDYFFYCLQLLAPKSYKTCTDGAYMDGRRNLETLVESFDRLMLEKINTSQSLQSLVACYLNEWTDFNIKILCLSVKGRLENKNASSQHRNNVFHECWFWCYLTVMCWSAGNIRCSAGTRKISETKNSAISTWTFECWVLLAAKTNTTAGFGSI